MPTDTLLGLADSLDACIEDAVRPIPHPVYGPGVYENIDPRIICLANGLKAISAALRAHQEERP